MKYQRSPPHLPQIMMECLNPEYNGVFFLRMFLFSSSEWARDKFDGREQILLIMKRHSMPALDHNDITHHVENININQYTSNTLQEIFHNLLKYWGCWGHSEMQTIYVVASVYCDHLFGLLIKLDLLIGMCSVQTAVPPARDASKSSTLDNRYDSVIVSQFIITLYSCRINS